MSDFLYDKLRKDHIGGVNMSNLPEELKYSEEHEWVKTEDGKVRIGITDFAQSELGDIVFVELPEVGDEIEADEPFGSVESVKTVSELYAPISGKVVEVNEELDDSPELVNESPYEKAWMIVVEPADASEVDKLMSAGEYAEMISED
ncbi:glycine cleavage system H protein [Shouchella clausii KSM-K16]|jgi:glycine cleavage system H protein|uniref:Glycine cleavage system H protein n=3 Tax=Shouchella TaxID=2893057 RepID=Q5WDP0_SHOC1|nr:glycine cleavage system H protein [Shouchella clausii KSM-K16]